MGQCEHDYRVASIWCQNCTDEKIQRLGGFLIVAVENITPSQLPLFIANYNNLNINGTNEETKDRNMFMLAAWANLFDYFEDVKVEKGYTFRKTNNDEIAVLTQRIKFRINYVNYLQGEIHDRRK